MDNDDDEIESWASLVLGLIAWIFFVIGLVAVVIAICMAWGYYTYEPVCGSVVSRFTEECRLP
jgi:hypothetical protein